MTTETFAEKIKTNKISKLFGKYFREEGGYFIGKFKDQYYFVSSNKHTKNYSFNESVEYCSNLEILGLPKNSFSVPTREELTFLGKIKEKFNDKCTLPAEEFEQGASYISSEREGDLVWCSDLEGVDYNDGDGGCYLDDDSEWSAHLVRPIRKIPA